MASSSGVSQIKSDEGKRSTGHMVDGVLHIGIGFNMEREDAQELLILAGVSSRDISKIMKVGGMALTDEQIDSLFDISLQQAENDVKDIFPNAANAPQAIKDVLVNMSFQLGGTSLRKFTDMQAAVTEGDWETMRAEMKDSKWAKQTPTRANRLMSQVGKVKTELPPKTATGRAVQAKELVANEVRQTRVTDMMSISSRQDLINSMIAATPVPEPVRLTHAEQRQSRQQILQTTEKEVSRIPEPPINRPSAGFFAY